MSLSHILTPLELAGLSAESRTKLDEALIEAYVQGADAEAMSTLTPLEFVRVRDDARRLLSRGQLGIPASRWFAARKE